MNNTIDKAKIRHAVMTGHAGEIRDLLLNGQQIELVHKISKLHVLGARELAEELDVSVPNASAKLSRLYKAGYLDRVTISADSGGIEHMYKTKEYGRTDENSNS